MVTILCQCAKHHRWFGWPNVVNVCPTCSGAAVNEYIMPVRRSGNVGDHADQALQRQLSVECCCTVELGGNTGDRRTTARLGTAKVWRITSAGEDAIRRHHTEGAA